VTGYFNTPPETIGILTWLCQNRNGERRFSECEDYASSPPESFGLGLDSLTLTTLLQELEEQGYISLGEPFDSNRRIEGSQLEVRYPTTDYTITITDKGVTLGINEGWLY
jgi:acyl carrier protein